MFMRFRKKMEKFNIFLRFRALFGTILRVMVNFGQNYTCMQVPSENDISKRRINENCFVVSSLVIHTCTLQEYNYAYYTKKFWKTACFKEHFDKKMRYIHSANSNSLPFFLCGRKVWPPNLKFITIINMQVHHRQSNERVRK